MYFDIRETVEKRDTLYKIFNSNNIYISDFYPYLNDKLYPTIPMSDMSKKQVFPLFKSVGSIGRVKYEVSNPVIFTGYCVESELDYSFKYNFDRYKEEFEEYTDILKRDGYTVYSRPVEELFTSFMEVQKVAVIGGMVALEFSELYPSTTVPVVKTHEVYDEEMPPIESYVINLLSQVDFVAFTLNTLLMLHNRLYVARGFSENNEPIWKYDIMVINHPNLRSRIKAVTKAVIKTLGNYNLDAAYVEDLLNGREKEEIFRSYFSEMNIKFGMSESESAHALVFYDTVFPEYRASFKQKFNVSTQQLKGRVLYIIPEINQERIEESISLGGLI